MEATRQPQSRAPDDRASYRSGFAFGTFSFFTATAVGLLSTIITARIYGVEVVGQFALVAAPVSALWILSTVREQQALIKEITGLPRRHYRITQLFVVVLSFSWALTTMVGILEAIACWFIFKGPLHSPNLIAPAFANIAGYVLLTNTGWNIDSILSAFVAGRELFWINLHQGLSFVGLAAAFSFPLHSVWGIVAAMLGAALSSLVHRVLVVRSFVRMRLTWAEFREGLRILPAFLAFGAKATPGQIAQGASQQGGIWAVGIVASDAVVGAYSRAMVIPQSLQAASMRITAVLYPTLVGRHQSGDNHGFDRAMIDSIRYEVIGMLLIAAVIGGAAHSVLSIFGPGFAQASPALVLLIIFPALASITVTQTQALWAIDRPGMTSLIAGVRLIVSIVLLVVLTPRNPIAGPAIAVLGGYLVTVVLSGLALRLVLAQPLRASWPVRERLVLVLAYIAGFSCSHVAEHSLPTLAGLPLSLGAGSAAYATVFLLCRGFNDRDRARFREFSRWLQVRIPPRTWVLEPLRRDV